MKRRRLGRALFLASILASILFGGDAFGFTCNNKIVSIGDTKAEVAMKCGEPVWRDAREEELTEKVDDKTRLRTSVTIDEWTYNFGPNAFVRILTFSNGKLTEIREGGYGFIDPKEPTSHCAEKKYDLSETKGEVRMHCGEPSWKEERKEELIETLDKDTKRKVTITTEEWTYNFGPNKFMRIFIFRNGKLREIKTGDYGY